MKKLIFLFVSLAMSIAIFAVTASAATNPGNKQSDEPVWNSGSIKVQTGIIEADKHRNDMQYSRGSSISWLNIPFWSNASAELYKGDELIASYTKNAKAEFNNLEEGTYTIRVSFIDSGHYTIFQSVVNGGPTPYLITEEYTDVEITQANPSVTKWVVAEPKAFDFKTTTDIGSFKNGTTELDYYPNTDENGNRNWAFENKDSTTSAKNPTFSTHSGIYYGDSASQYTEMDDLEIPALNEEEKAKGYTFKGWQLVAGGTPSDKLYSTKQALSYVITEDTVFKACWEHPSHNVTFKTSKSKGTLSPASNETASSYSYKVNFNNQKIGDLNDITTIPAATAKEGYTFVGWCEDLTMDELTEDEIKNMVVDKDITLYAKYTKTSSSDTPSVGDEPNTGDTPGDNNNNNNQTTENTDKKATPNTSGDEETSAVDTKKTPNSKSDNSAGKISGLSNKVVNSTAGTSTGVRRYSSAATGDPADFLHMWIISLASLAVIISLGAARRKMTNRV